jgi:hypothetical protein
MAEYFTGFVKVAVILNTEVRSSDIIAGNSFAALSSLIQPFSLKDFRLITYLHLKCKDKPFITNVIYNL